MMRRILCLLLLSLISKFSVSYKILVVFHPPGKSHNILGDGHVQALLSAGHEVTYVTPFLGKHSHPNYTEVDISRNVKLMPFSEIINIKKILEGSYEPSNWVILANVTLMLDTLTLTNENMQKLMRDPNIKFDAVIVEWFYSDIYAGLSAVFDCPFIWFLSTEPAWMQMALIDDSINPAYSSDPFSLAAPPFTFYERVMELWNQIYGSFSRAVYLTPGEKQLYEQIYGPILKEKGRVLPIYEETKYNISLMLGNSHVSMGSSIRLPQSYKPIGGFHINPEVKPLPDNLQKIMDSSKYGIIYFSMGSNLRSKDMPYEMKHNLLKMFGELKYTVIWKVEETIPNVPKNVHILQWAPQPSILSHPKCVLFITHGGLLSTTETVHFGIPIIGIPTFADQFVNVVRAVIKGYARKVDLSVDMASSLKANIEEILNDPSYTARAKELSMIYHDRVATPRAELVHWVEHVVRTRGAPHLRSPALQVPLYQKLYLDLVALLLAAALLLRVLLKCLTLLVFPEKDVKRKKTKKH